MPRKKPSSRKSERVSFARQQRQQANEFSRELWQMVRDRRMLGEKFRREYPLGPYTLDFACLDLKLNLEIDGQDHLTDEGKQHDQKRDNYVRQMGFEVLRIPGYRVIQNRDNVYQEIARMIRKLTAKIPFYGFRFDKG
jgi:very-short-patch-repair endonuclease